MSDSKMTAELALSELTVLSIHDIYTLTQERGTSAKGTAAHSTLIKKHSGSTEYLIGADSLEADTEHMLFIPSGTPYSATVTKEGACTVIEFDTKELCNIKPCQIYTGNDPDMNASIKELLHYYTLKGPAYRSKCLSELYALLTEIANIQSFSSTLAGKYGLIHRSVKYIETSYKNPELYTGTLAEISGMGETYYRNIFTSVFGIAPTKYIQQYRVEKAKELLLNTSYTIDEIAEAVGFANASYFCKVFKTVTGMTPSKYVADKKIFG